MKYFIPALTFLYSLAALAQEHGAAHGAESHEIQTKLITYQTINVIILVGGLIYFLRQPLRDYFKEKRASFLSAAKKAEAARKAAEDQRHQIQVRLNKLESTADESIARARAEAADMKKQLVAEAEAISKRIREEAQEAARLEVEKAKRNLRETLIKESLEVARNQLGTKVTAEDHKRLQSDFLSHIQAVQK
jgi:F-type H+-transporting ATPase subunit b